MSPVIGLPIQYFTRLNETDGVSKMLGGVITGTTPQGEALLIWAPNGIFMTTGSFSEEVLPGTWRAVVLP